MNFLLFWFIYGCEVVNLCKLACRKMSCLYLFLCEEIWSSHYTRIFCLSVKVLEEFALVSFFLVSRTRKALVSLQMKCMQCVEAALSGQGCSVKGILGDLCYHKLRGQAYWGHNLTAVTALPRMFVSVCISA